MSRPSALWRLLMWIERRLPRQVLAAVDAGPAPTNHGKTTGKPRRWVVLAVVLPIMTVNLVQVARHRYDLATMWPAWRPMILDLTLLVAGAVLVAGIAFGVHAWRQAKRLDHA